MKKLLLLFALISVTLISSCGKDDELNNEIRLDTNSVSLNSLEEHQINVTSELSLSYQTEDGYHAQVDNKGMVTAMYVGETNILLSNGKVTKEFKVIVEPKYNTYPEPNIEFGETKESVIAKFGTPDREIENSIAYFDYSFKAPRIAINFENNKVKSYLIAVETAYSSELGSFFAERYKLVAVDPDTRDMLFWNSLDEPKIGDLGVLVSLANLDYWTAFYMQRDGSSRSTSSSYLQQIKDMKLKYSNLLNKTCF